jgi:hypothetical protein
MKEYKKSTTSERRSVYNLNFKLLFYMKTLIHLEKSKWSATSPVTLCMLTGPLIFFAMAGVGIAPRDTEYRMGRWAFAEPEQAHSMYHRLYPEKIEGVKFMQQRVLYTSLTQTLFHLRPSYYQIHNHVSLQIKKKKRRKEIIKAKKRLTWSH